MISLNTAKISLIKSWCEEQLGVKGLAPGTSVVVMREPPLLSDQTGNLPVTSQKIRNLTLTYRQKLFGLMTYCSIPSKPKQIINTLSSLTCCSFLLSGSGWDPSQGEG